MNNTVSWNTDSLGWIWANWTLISLDCYLCIALIPNSATFCCPKLEQSGFTHKLGKMHIYIDILVYCNIAVELLPHTNYNEGSLCLFFFTLIYFLWWHLVLVVNCLFCFSFSSLATSNIYCDSAGKVPFTYAYIASQYTSYIGRWCCA